MSKCNFIFCNGHAEAIRKDLKFDTGLTISGMLLSTMAASTLLSNPPTDEVGWMGATIGTLCAFGISFLGTGLSLYDYDRYKKETLAFDKQINLELENADNFLSDANPFKEKRIKLEKPVIEYYR